MAAGSRFLSNISRRVWGRARQTALNALGRTSFGTVTSVRTAKPVVAITFDGGPDERWTPQVLDVLDAHKAKATFFVIGKYIDAHPEIAERQYASGHVLGNHTYEHPSFPLVSSVERLKELRRCADTLTQYPQKQRLFRAPYLDQGLRSRFDTWRRGYTDIACSLHANDWEDIGAEEIAAKLIDKAQPGDIIMLHDAVCDQRYRSRAAMIEALDRFLGARRDLGFVTVPDLMQMGRPVRGIWLKRPNLARFATYERDI